MTCIGPSLADVDDLCEEFEFHLEGDGLEILQKMITAAITRWPAPVAHPAAQPVNLAELHDPDFSGGLTPSQHLDVLHGGAHPGFSGCHDGPTVAAVRAADAAISDEALEAEFRAWWWAQHILKRGAGMTYTTAESLAIASIALSCLSFAIVLHSPWAALICSGAALALAWRGLVTP